MSTPQHHKRKGQAVRHTGETLPVSGKCIYPIGETHSPKEYRLLQSMFRANKLLAYNEAIMEAEGDERTKLESVYSEYKKRLQLCPISFRIQSAHNAEKIETLIAKAVKP